MRHRSLITLGALLVAIGLSWALLPKRWIEEVIGFEPDGGSGLVELLLAIVPAGAGITLIAVAVARRATRRPASAAPGNGR